MRSNIFDITEDAASGGLTSIELCGDEYKMNWCESASAVWGVPFYNAPVAFNRDDPMRLTDCREGASVYENALAMVTAERFFTDGGNLRERYTFINKSGSELFIGEGEYGIYTPFNDNYEAAGYCLINKCHTHIYCGGSCAWVCALRMGESSANVGLVLTSGAIDAYRQCLPPYAKNDRGDFILCAEAFSLLPDEEYVIEWELFRHSGKQDFRETVMRYPGEIYIETENETLFRGESLKLTAYFSGVIEAACVTIDGRESEFITKENKVLLNAVMSEPGEHGICVTINGRKALCSVFTSLPLDELIEKRVDFIVTHQQQHSPGSALDGAYLIYDNESGTRYFSAAVADHNASRERIGMGILVAKYLRTHSNAAVQASLRKYTEFVLREFVDPETGDVFDTIGRDPSQIRLYNAPWVCCFMCELYELWGDKSFLETAVRVMRKYYEGGGDRFYPNAISIAEPVELLRRAGMTAESDELFGYARRHTENIIANGTDYPKHEVDYEQTITAPALTFILQMYKLTGDSAYLEAARPHLALLERFNGFAPDYHLDEVAIRHWDGYWFGKSKTFGDTLPHYWSVLTGWAFELYSRAAGERDYHGRACRSARNCLCLFMPDGSASCAYLYPYMINEKKGKYFDAWANDQDFALYYAMKIIPEGEK